MFSTYAKCTRLDTPREPYLTCLMALRVLLADESSTIKRVMQLALQDFAVEVKAVHAGVDVLEVARTYKPDIVFADVLLQKKNGYEVSAELKGDAELNATPVVLMWSSFMELDQAAYKRSKADGKLEKPFDVETLRKLVQDNVARLKSDRLSEYLQFPSNISAPLSLEEQKRESEAKAKTAQSISESKSQSVIITPPPPPPTETVTKPVIPVSDDDFGRGFEVSDLTATSHRQASDLPPPPPSEPENEDWVKQDISKFTLDLAPVKIEGEDAAISFDIHHGSLEGEKQLTSTSFSNEPTTTKFNLRSPPLDRTKAEEIPFPDFDRFQATDAHLPVLPEIEFEPSELEIKSDEPLQLEKQLSAEQLEKIIRAQSKEVIEEVVKRVVPEIATQLIREELNRLISEGAQ